MSPPREQRSRPPAGTASSNGTGKHHNVTSGYWGAQPGATPEGLERALKVTRRDWWSESAARAIAELVAAGRPFTSEDVVRLVGEPWEPHLLGAVLAGAQRSRLITVVSAVIGHDGQPRRVWEATE